MAGLSSRRGRRQELTFTIPAAGGGPGGSNWATPQELTELSKSGLLSRWVLRAPAAAPAGQTLAVKIYQGPYDNTTDPDTVPDERTIFHRTGIAVAGHATTADDDLDLLQAFNGISYDVKRDADSLWISLELEAGLTDPGNIAVVEAVDTL